MEIRKVNSHCWVVVINTNVIITQKDENYFLILERVFMPNGEKRYMDAVGEYFENFELAKFHAIDYAKILLEPDNFQ